MRSIPFEKYHGTGNDFILILDLEDKIRSLLNQSIIERWCSRRYGIGADGLMLVQSSDSSDFTMVYFNSDGRQSTMCGNGGRCIAHFAHTRKVAGSTMRFTAIDGEHKAVIKESFVELEMQDSLSPTRYKKGWIIDTGSPHYVEIRDVFPDDIVKEAHTIRYDERFTDDGINVNYVVFADGEMRIRTYERGVEGETHSCGTGVTAAALVHMYLHEDETSLISMKAIGGRLSVSAEKTDEGFKNVWLSGPATYVFSGELKL